MPPRAVAVSAGLLLAVSVVIAGCGSGGGGVGRGLEKRLRGGFAMIKSDRTLSIETSITRDDTDPSQTLSCLVVDVDPRYPTGDHVHITNWGSGTTLDADGGCLGGGDPHEIAVAGDLVYVAAGAAPKGQLSCIASYRRERLSGAARNELAGFTRSQGPKVDDLLAAAESSSVEGKSSVRIDLDPDKAASLSRTSSGSSSAHPDSMFVTVTFAGPRSNRITNLVIDTSSGDDTVEVHANYYRAKPADAGPPSAVCLQPGIGTLASLDELKSALGF